ncbi:hypothetical protein [Cohnella terricola]|uniref:Uncharacterized protein n=1 Tax=Cohnella terricola TaxID=1289167 RepID=A0A559JT38_9BACL|nr:hypothetical protein [Cohnella terricola]TVY03035.1 hypothetical protein FPZ45_03855 [Cohnella terricola]
MDRIKKHAAIPALVAALVIVIAFGVNAYGLKDKGMIELKDLQGNREAIADIKFGGELRDGVHRMAFDIDRGKVSANTELFRQPNNSYVYRYAFGGSKRTEDGMEYSVENYTSTYKFTSRKLKYWYTIPVGNAEVTLPVAYHDPEGRADSITLANSPEYGLAKIGDKVYFTAPLSSYFTGSSGIYELKFYDWGFGPGANPKVYDPRKVVDIPLEAKKPDGSSGMEILGLEAVNGRLALITVENNKLYIRSYDNETGELLGEASVQVFFLSGKPDSQLPAGAAAYSEGYEAYIDRDRPILTLSFRTVSSGEERRNTTVFSFDFTDGVNLADTTYAFLNDGEEDTYSGIKDMIYRNGKLYVIKSWREPENEHSRTRYEVARPKHMYVYVYEHSKLIYKGELMTEMNDDNIRTYNLYSGMGGFGYDQMDYRYFANIAIE